jgi:hypothetical protein
MIRLYLWFCRVLFCCTRTMGAVGTRPSLRPLSFEGGLLEQLGHFVPRERGLMFSVIPGRCKASNYGAQLRT